jgi:hypothetical protein
VGVSFIVGIAGFLIICLFGSYLGSEWAYWIAAILVRYAELYARPDVNAVADRGQQAWLTEARTAGEAA